MTYVICHFVVNKSHDEGVLYIHDMWLLILFFLFLYSFCNGFKFTNSKKAPTMMQSHGDSRGGKPLKKVLPPLQWQWIQLSIETTISLTRSHSSNCAAAMMEALCSLPKATVLACFFVTGGRDEAF